MWLNTTYLEFLKKNFFFLTGYKQYLESLGFRTNPV